MRESKKFVSRQRERAQKEKQALDEARKTNKQAEKTELEGQLREKYGVRVRGLVHEIGGLVKQLAEKRVTDTIGYFPDYSNWLGSRFADQWETFNVSSEVWDFGKVQWGNRPLDAIIVKAVIQQKNRILGKYEDHFYLFGLVDDIEFEMKRNTFSVECSDLRLVEKWKVGGSFKTQWNAD